MSVLDGVLWVGTPLCVPDKENLRIGKVASIMLNGKPINEAWENTGDVSVKIEGEPNIQVGRNFDESMKICSIISKQSIEALKENFRDDMSKDDWKLVIKLKKVFGIL